MSVRRLNLGTGVHRALLSAPPLLFADLLCVLLWVGRHQIERGGVFF